MCNVKDIYLCLSELVWAQNITAAKSLIGKKMNVKQTLSRCWKKKDIKEG